MGCGFSSAGDKLTASDEERILEGNAGNEGGTNNNTGGMGGNQSKSKSKRKANQGNISGMQVQKVMNVVADAFEFNGQLPKCYCFYIVHRYVNRYPEQNTFCHHC